MDEGKPGIYVSTSPRYVHGYVIFAYFDNTKELVFTGDERVQQCKNQGSAKDVLRRINPTPVAARDLEYSLPFSYPRGQNDPHCRRSMWEQWQESSFLASLNFTWNAMFKHWQEGRHPVRLQTILPEFYRCPRCRYRYPHVCGYHWTRQSYFGVAGSGIVEGIQPVLQQICKCHSTFAAVACLDNDKPSRAARRFWREASPYPRA